ncbi:WAP four-disulfide core domain protein 12 [Tupaia chinensis]|uniref:WAP four-disulfide core domain protein 12 n=1 Tax=Tupaia chinensis TaxID=246437 RepID=UPI0003C8E858|nr:WAP four-disulfide core domain protein 12 [Tupaia chinensis]
MLCHWRVAAPPTSTPTRDNIKPGSAAVLSPAPTSSMCSDKFVVFAVVLVFVALLAGEGVQTDQEKKGVCPVNRVRCIKSHFRSDSPQCLSDQDCWGKMKCCQVWCTLLCVDPKAMLDQGGSKDEDSSRPCSEPRQESRPLGSSPSTRCTQK